MENELPYLTPCATLHHDQSVIFSKFEAFLEFLCSLNRKEFRSFTDADVFNRLTSSKIDVETCFENNRAQPEAQDEDYGAVQEVKPIGMDFCAFDIQVAMTCTKSIFDDTQDLAGFEAYTNFFSTQFTCDSYVSDNRAEESFYATLFDRKEGEEISFYGDFLTLIGDFFAN